MFSSSKILMARPSGRYQIGSDITLPGSDGGMCMNADGTVVAVFARTQNDTNLVEVRRWTGSSWSPVGFSNNISALFPSLRPGGFCMDGPGTTLVVGLPDIYEPDTGTGGEVRIFRWDGSWWSDKGFASNPRQGTIGFGSSVGLSRDGNRLAVGALDDRTPNVSNPGQPSPFVAVYDWVEATDGGANGPSVPGTWVLDRVIEGGTINRSEWSDSAISDMTGRSVSLSSEGDVAAWGVLMQDGSGGVIVQTLPCADCGPGVVSFMFEQSPVSDSRTENPLAVSLSGDGGTVAVSDGPYISESDMAIPPSTRIYRRTGSDGWLRMDHDEVRGVARLSHDGNVMATSEGYVYRWDGSAWVGTGGRIWVPSSYGESCSVSHDGTVVAVAREESAGYVCRVYRWV